MGKKEVMNSEALPETLEVLKAISDLELALAGFYQFCSRFRECNVRVNSLIFLKKMKVHVRVRKI